MTIDIDLHEYIRQLRTAGAELPMPLAQRIVAGGEHAVAALVALAIDTDLLNNAVPLCYAPLHALRLLGEIRSLACITPLIHAGVPAAPDKTREQRATIWDGEIPQIIARIGQAAFAPLLDLLDDDHTSNIGHHRAAIALAYLSLYALDMQPAVVAALEARLGSSDTDRNASAALALANMGSESSYKVVMEAYKAGLLSKDAVQPGPLRQLLLSRSNARLACVNHPLGERYAHHPLNEQPRT